MFSELLDINLEDKSIEELKRIIMEQKSRNDKLERDIKNLHYSCVMGMNTTYGFSDR